jgi:hypothetical protein
MKFRLLPLILVALLFFGGGARAQEDSPSAQDIAAARTLFATILKSEDKAKDHVITILAYSMHSPYSFSLLQTMTQRLAVAGFSIDEIDEALKPCGDMAIAAGGDRDEWGLRLVAVLSVILRLKHGPDSVGNCLDVLEAADVPAYSYLAEASGKTVQNIRSLVDQNRVRREGAGKIMLLAFRIHFDGLAEKFRDRKS